MSSSWTTIIVSELIHLQQINKAIKKPNVTKHSVGNNLRSKWFTPSETYNNIRLYFAADLHHLTYLMLNDYGIVFVPAKPIKKQLRSPNP